MKGHTGLVKGAIKKFTLVSWSRLTRDCRLAALAPQGSPIQPSGSGSWRRTMPAIIS